MKKCLFEKTDRVSIVMFSLILAVVMLVSVVSASNGFDSQLTQVDNSIQHSIDINSDNPQMGLSDFKEYVKDMEANYGSDEISALKSVLRSITGEPDTTSNLNYVGAWTDHISETGGSSDCALLLYKFNQADSSGKDHYYYWQWTSAQPDHLFVLKNFWNKVQLTNSNSRLITYTPGLAISGNEVKINVGLSAGYSETTFKIGGDFILHEDVVRPKSGACQVGYGGKYAVEWNGFCGNAQEIKGAMHVDVPTGQSISATWTNSLSIT